MRNHHQNSILTGLTWVVIVAGLLVIALALVRFGGPTGLWQRAETKMAAWKPHPVAVPTPLSVARADLGQMGNRSGRTLLVALQPPVVLPTVTATSGGADGAVAQLVTPSVGQSVLGFAPAASFVELSGIQHVWQSWNNCGPATLSMQLNFLGSVVGQDTIGAALRSHEDDKNVLPTELADYARSLGYQAQVLVNGSRDTLRLLLSNGLPVLVETWLEDEPNNGMGHYRLLTGYDDAARQWFAYDSYVQHNPRNPDPNGPYQGIVISYDEFEPLWKVFNRTYLVVYPSDRAATVAGIVGADLDPQQMWQRAGQAAEQALAQYPNDAFGWFNLGTSLAELGRFEEAAAVYDHARQLGLPWRMLWYQFGPFQAYYVSGRHAEVIALADATIQTTGSIEELFYWRGQALAAQGQTSDAEQAWQEALRLNPRFSPATEALTALGN